MKSIMKLMDKAKEEYILDMPAQKAYWENEFADEVPQFNLPGMKKGEYKKELAVKSMGKELSSAVQEVSKKRKVSEYAIFLAAVMIEFGKYSRSEDIVVGCPIIEDTLEETISNVVPLRGKPEKEKKCADFIEEIRGICESAFRNRLYPMEELKKTVSESNLYDICLVIEEEISGNTSEPDCKNLAETDFVFFVEKEESEYKINFQYNSAAVSEKIAEGMLAHLVDVLAQISGEMPNKIQNIEMITEEERKQISQVFNHTEKKFSCDKALQHQNTIVNLIEKQVETNGDKIALEFEDASMTYEELNQRANTVAYRLQEIGIGANDLVAILAKRSFEMIIGILGILKAGAAYVPMDPEYPDERIQYMLLDCQAKAVLVYKAELQTKLPVLNMEESWALCKNNANLNLQIKENDLAYVIYTSGTTGKPKGVLVEHHGITNLCMSYTEIYNITFKDIILQAANYIFDQSVWDIFNSLAAGATLCLVPYDTVRNPEQLSVYCNEHKVTVAAITPALIQELDPSKFKTIRLLESGGEAANRQILNKWVAHEVKVFNTYGPTEYTVNTTTYSYEGDISGITIPIGKPIYNTKLFIMEDGLECGIGIPGELCISGIGMARGYLNRDELTKEKFTDSSYGTMYHTGDLARWLPDGNVECLGRIDEQVKIRGFRIELQEVENVLRKIEGIRDCAVIARKDASGENALYAYFCANQEMNLTTIRDVLSQSLPNYMVPAYMMQIPNIPVTRNGKLDRKSLPVIKVKSQMEYIAPRNEAEIIISRLFGNVLNLEKVSVKDDFFFLGGHSLRATKLLNQLEAETGKRIALRKIFTHSTVEQLAALLVEEKEDVYVPIPKAKPQEYYPMSSAQKRTYLICQMDGEGIVYNMPEIIRIHGKMEPDKLQKALNQLVARHEILRTEFVMQDGKPVQRILKELEIPLTYEEENSQTESELLREFVRPFDLAKAPLIRLHLTRKSDEEYLLFLDVHHIVGDGMSMVNFASELSKLYNGAVLEKENCQYCDYSEWMRTRDFESQKAYWVEQFSDEIPVLDMPLDFIRPQKQSYQGDIISWKTDKVLGSQIHGLLKRTQTTEYMVFLSAMMITLGKYSRQEDIIIGSPMSGRIHKDTENMIGMFVNTLAMRGKPEANKSCIQFLKEIKKSCFAAYENQEYPFEELIEAINLERDMSRNPLFDVMLTMQNNEKEEYDFHGSKAEVIEAEEQVAKFDLSLDIVEDDGAFEFILEYCTDLFYKETARNFLLHFAEVLSQMAQQEEKRIKDIKVLTKEEEDKILGVFNQTFVEYPKEKLVMQRFEEQAAKTPDRIALALDDETMTYAQLNERANAVAYHLRELGVKPNDFVALLTERSFEMIIGIYGVLKAGGAYVPMDPAYPVDRIHYMLEDCKPKLILVYNTQIDSDIPVIDLKESKEWNVTSVNPESVNQPDDVVYSIYTSGTTGKPKGVVIEHNGLSNLMVAYTKIYHVTEEDVVLQVANYIFDQSVWDIFNILLLGGTLCLIPYDKLRNPEVLAEYCNEHKVTIASFTPALITELNPLLFKTLRILDSSGEAANREVLDRWTGRGLEVMNTYGPTEYTVNTCSYTYSGNSKAPSIPIGTPICNTQMYIVDGQNLCGIGVPGELCIAGYGMARGYLNRPDLTNEKFIENPYGSKKLYRTGDLARWLPDGNVECLGRIDEQVKIRGFRIELGEIENALRKISKVKDCAVIVRKDTTGEKAIYAYLVSEKTVKMGDIRDTLSRTLPEYMIPGYMAQIESIPVTPSGKLDRRALPDIEVKSQREYIAPRNENEAILCEIFAKILGVEKVGAKDSFFELGGHSLRATRLINQIEEKTGKGISLRDIFTCVTVEKLAEVLGQIKQVEDVSIVKAEEKEYYLMSSPQKRIYFICQMDARGTVYNMPEVVKLKGNVDKDVMKHAFFEMVRRHEILRTKFLMVNGEPVQCILSEAEPEFTYEENHEKSEAIWMQEFIRPFDLEQAPLVRMKLVKTGEQEYLLLTDMHHIISDGMSMVNFSNELAAIYNGESLTELPSQYKDYSEWMNQRDLEKQKQFWVQEFKEAAPVLDLPLDFKRPQEQSYKGAMVHTQTGITLGKQVKELAKKTGSTEYMVFLAALMIELGTYARQEDIVVGCPISGRTNSDTENMLGMFVNTMALRGKPEKKKTGIEFLEELKNTCLLAYENQEYPFEKLVEAVQVKRDMSRNPLFDVLLSLQNNEMENYHFKDIKADYFEPEEKIAKFDLAFDILEKEGNYVIDLEYCTELFRKETAERMIQHFLEVLNQFTKNTTQCLKEIKVITKQEEEMIYHTFNDTKAYFPSEMTIVEALEEQVVKHKNQTALVFEEETLTFIELNERANAVAYKLKELGIQREDFVAILAKRSIEVVVAIYGVLKAGAAYVPMDPAYPQERIQYMLEDCKPKAVLCYQAGKHKDFIAKDITVLDLAEYKEWKVTKVNPERVNTCRDLAYCIYTSGTTGKPKGVLVEHIGVLNLREYFLTKQFITKKDHALQFASMAFDAMVSELSMSILAGAALYMVPESVQQEPKRFEQFVKENQITIGILPPAYLHQVSLEGMRTIITAGSETSQELVKANRHIAVYSNDYGPTEVTVCASYWRHLSSEEVPFKVPIGKPIQNKQIYIMDGENLCGVGIPGELCIAGTGIARGYLNRPELTDEKFVANPFGDGKLYRSGDLARWLPDGNVEYLGRMDEQVKIRGFRIELQEIESVLRKLEEITDCAVVAKNDKTGEKAVFAYFVAQKEQDIDYIRTELRKFLPDYMLPSYFMQLDAIKVTPNGKVDKKALPEIEAKSHTEYIAPKNQVEEVLCNVMAEVLGTKQIGIRDNFFDLGGDSIKAIRIISKMRDAGYTVTVKDIMYKRTVEEIAPTAFKILEQVEYNQGEITGEVMNTPIIREFVSMKLKKPSHYNQSEMLKVSDGSQKSRMNPDVIRKALEAIVLHHDMLRAVYKNGSLFIQNYEKGKNVSFTEYDVTGEMDVSKKMECICSKEQESIDLETGPLMRAAFLKADDGDYLMICIHHLVVDGVSWRILMEDLETAKHQILNGVSVKLPMKTAAFKEWAMALSEYKESTKLKKEESYWKKVISKMNEVKEFKPDETESETGYEDIEIAFSKEVTDQLLHKAGLTYNTQMNDLLLAALGMSISKLRGYENIAIKLEGHGREQIHKQIDVDRTVGWFTSVYPIILDCEEDTENAIIKTKEMLRKVPNKGIGYGLLKEKYGARPMEFCFNYLGEMDSEASDMTLKYSTGLEIAKENTLMEAIAMDGSVEGGRLAFHLQYDKGKYKKSTMEQFASLYKQSIEAIISFCLGQEETTQTMSDFIGEDDSIDLDDFDEILNLL